MVLTTFHNREQIQANGGEQMGLQSRSRILLFLLILTSAQGCLDFGDDEELLGQEVTAQHLQKASALTGIQFPPGSIGVAYYYIGSGIDDSLAIKVSIPLDKKEEFLRNPIFLKGQADKPHIQIGISKSWWNLESLINRVDRTLELPQGQFVECTSGVEGGMVMVYISWIST